jgi:LuxR family maltose regulon positive regulatory protein
VIAPLLRHAATRGAHREYARRLLAAIDGTAAPAVPTTHRPGMVESLSDRELEVLRLVAVGLPNRDIGQRLFISEKTVKTHLSNILGKLETTNRTQAVDQARRLGLL